MQLICIAAVLICSAAEFSLVIPNASVSAWLGSSVVLPCSLSPPLNARTFEIQWSKKEDSEKPVLFYQDQKVQENTRDAQYRDRVSLIGELQKGDISLTLKNLMVADEGEYVCFVQSSRWYEKGSMNLVVKALGTPALVSCTDAGVLPSQTRMVNVTCTSDGWSPKPTLTWRDSAGQELANSHIHYRTDLEGLVSVSSWLLYSTSDSEWISCTVGLNHQHMRESRIVPLRESWREAFITTLMLSLIIITLTVLLILFRKGFLPHCSSRKNAKAAAADSHKSSPAEAVPHNPTENTNKAADSHESLLAETVPLNPTENTNKGTSPLYVPPEPTQEPSFKDRYKARLTLDPSTADGCLKVTRDCKSVLFKKPKSVSKSKFPHVLSKEELGSGQHYWEVMLWDKAMMAQPKSSWCIGVTRKPHSENVLTALCYEEGTGLKINTNDFSTINTKYSITKLGLHLNCEWNALSFYNADKTSDNHLYTFYNIPKDKYFAFFSPGVQDGDPVKILHSQENSE